MKANELRKKYLEFFKSKGHAIIPSASLIPENDPSTLFTTAGMQPIVPNLLGEKHPEGKRIVNSQKCIRTVDFDEVGDKTHHTFFEMLGHWSLGDYFKQEAIEMTYEFLTKELKLDPSKLAVTVFAGDENAPEDKEAVEVWKKVGVPEKRIAYLPKEDNWWEPAGSSGPCGPSTEMFFWTDQNNVAPETFDPEDSRWVEISNDVLMEYEKIGEARYKTATQKNIDNGTGLERTLAVVNGLDDNYLTNLFSPIINKIEEVSNKKYNEDEKITRLMRIIADHMRTSVFILGDEKKITPSNVEQGYILRRLIRIAIRQLKQLDVEKNVTVQIAGVCIDIMKDAYPEVENNKKFIFEQLKIEEEAFRKTLSRGLKEFEKMSDDKVIDGKEAFILFATYGFPFEMTQNLAKEAGVEIRKEEFDEEFKKHQDISRTATQGKFKGGLADHSETATSYHTATHLLLAALRKVLGDHVFQKGSNITDERLRFDFSHPDKLTDEQKEEVEKIVNDIISKDYKVKVEEMPLDEAKKSDAIGVFEQKYGEKVKVYTIYNPETSEVFSKEICGGPHVENVATIKSFKIKKEQASSAGIRRIKAVIS